MQNRTQGLSPGIEQLARKEINKIPGFLNAIGHGTQAVGVTLYGGDGGNWHFAKVAETGNCQPIDIRAEGVLDDIHQYALRGRGKNHQLGFYPQWGGSTKAQSEGSCCLKVECDTLSKDEQLAALQAFEHCYDVQFSIVDTGGKSFHAYLAVDEVISVDRYQLVCRCFHQLLADTARMEGIAYEADDALLRGQM